MKYTLCFLTKGEEVLMLLRAKEPNKGKWNGVGGKIEANETPAESCQREVLEETGLSVTHLIFRGIISLDGDESIAVFICGDFKGHLIASSEGVLEWKKKDWILSSSEVVENIPLFLEDVLDIRYEPKEYACRYSSTGEMIGFKIKPLAGSAASMSS